MEPGAAVMFVSQQLVQHIADDNCHQLRSFNNCKHTEIICLIVAKLALCNGRKDEKDLEKAIRAVEQKMSSQSWCLHTCFKG